jgi:excisionase family DNA binding protein
MRLAEAAAALGISHNTLRHWSDEGRLTCYRSPGGHRRYRRADIEAALHDLSGTAPPARPEATSLSEGTWQESALEALVSVAARATGATSCCIVVEDGGEHLRIVAAQGDGEIPPAGTSVPISALPAEAEVVHSRRRLLIPDVSRTRLLARAAADDYCRKGLLGLLLLPIALQDGLVGVLRLGDSRGSHSFDKAAVGFAEFMAHHAGVLLAGGQTPLPALADLRHADGSEPPSRPAAAGASSWPFADDRPPGLGDLPSQVAEAAAGALQGRPELAWCTVYLVENERATAIAGTATAAEWDLDEFPPAAAAMRSGRVELVRADDRRLSSAARLRFFDERDVTAVVLAPVAGAAGAVALIEAGGHDLGLFGTPCPRSRRWPRSRLRR